MSGKMPPEPLAPYPDCMLCGDTGLQHLPDYPPCYRFCACKAGIARCAAEPNLVDEANEREALLLRPAKAGAAHAVPVQGGRD